MCKSGSYLLGFVCNSSAAAGAAGAAVNPQASTANGMLSNGTPRIYRDSEDPSQRISCIDTGSVNEEEYVHYSSEHRFPSFSDFYNFNNRNANLTGLNESNRASVTDTPTLSAMAVATCSSVRPLMTNPITSNAHNLSLSAAASSSTAQTTLASSSNFGTPIASTHQMPPSSLPFGQFKFTNGGPTTLAGQTISAMVNSNTIASSTRPPAAVEEESSTSYVTMYQSNVDEDGDPVDGPLRCTRTTVLNSSTETGPSSHTVVQMQPGNGRGVLNCKPVYI